MTRKRYFTGSRFEERGGYARTFIVAQLVDPRMKIEIEVTTRDGGGAG
tara:strand:+ start:523 stop:666 length:144 start_codon:yes stop_codon:yes gene_type:complete